jgi:hypothetical protein
MLILSYQYKHNSILENVSHQYTRNHAISDTGVLGFVHGIQNRKPSHEVRQITPKQPA